MTARSPCSLSSVGASASHGAASETEDADEAVTPPSKKSRLEETVRLRVVKVMADA